MNRQVCMMRVRKSTFKILESRAAACARVNNFWKANRPSLLNTHSIIVTRGGDVCARGAIRWHIGVRMAQANEPQIQNRRDEPTCCFTRQKVVQRYNLSLFTRQWQSVWFHFMSSHRGDGGFMLGAHANDVNERVNGIVKRRAPTNGSLLVKSTKIIKCSDEKLRVPIFVFVSLCPLSMHNLTRQMRWVFLQ